MRGKGGRASERRALPRLGEGASEMTARSWAVALVLAASAPIWAATPQQHVAAARAAEKRSDWRKPYEAYLADPLALPANAARVKAKIAALEAPAGGTMALALPAPPADPKGKQVAAASPLPALDMPAPPPLPLPELDAPAAKTAPAKKSELALALPDLPGAASSSKPALAAATPSSGAKPAVAKPPPAPEPRKAPADAIATETARPSPAASGGGARRTAAWIAAGVAVVALGGGVFAYTKASSAQNDLTGSVHDGATAKSLLDSEKQNKTLSVIGLAGGLAAAGVSAVLFAF